MSAKPTPPGEVRAQVLLVPAHGAAGRRIRTSQEADMASQQHGTPARAPTDRPGLRSALWLPLFDSLADPALVARLAAEAEQAGLQGREVRSARPCPGR